MSVYIRWFCTSPHFYCFARTVHFLALSEQIFVGHILILLSYAFLLLPSSFLPHGSKSMCRRLSTVFPLHSILHIHSRSWSAFVRFSTSSSPSSSICFVSLFGKRPMNNSWRNRIRHDAFLHSFLSFVANSCEVVQLDPTSICKPKIVYHIEYQHKLHW